MASLIWDTLLGDGSQLLGDSSQWLDHEFDCPALFAPASDKLKTALHNEYKALED